MNNANRRMILLYTRSFCTTIIILCHSFLAYAVDTHVPLQNNAEKEWTFIVYMAADNDLRSFAAKNIKQMTQIGSNEHVNIVVHLDIRISGNKKVTRRYYIKKDTFVHMNADDPQTQSMDSGDQKTLISCCKWAIETFPARHYALVFWNHGSGILDTERGRLSNVIELFVFNPATQMLELDRHVSPFDFLYDRGVCWDDTTGNYLTNQKLDAALREICTNYLNNKKFDIIGFDACFMSMLEVGNIMKQYAHFMVGSQEVELGTGWYYDKVLAPFAQGSIAPADFAIHIVNAYHNAYQKITNDYTQSAIKLDGITTLEQEVDLIAQILLVGLKNQKNSSVSNAIKKSSDKSVTHFSEPGYIDFHHWCRNLLNNLQSITLHNANETMALKQDLQAALQRAIITLEKIVLANTSGKNLAQARGLSIYFPLHDIHNSYKKTIFASNNSWPTFLKNYLRL